MVADGADLGSLGANDDMAAVAAFPHLDLALLEDGGRLDVLEQGAVALLVVLLDGADLAELLGELGETLFLGGLGELVVHVGPLEVLAVGRGTQVLGRVADALELAQPHLCVVLLVGARLTEDLGDLLEALLLCHGREVDVLVRRLRLAGKGRLQVLLGPGALVLTHA